MRLTLKQLTTLRTHFFFRTTKDNLLRRRERAGQRHQHLRSHRRLRFDLRSKRLERPHRFFAQRLITRQMRQTKQDVGGH